MRLGAMAESKKRRPMFFNLLQIQMPVGALTSIIHRVTGIFLALSIPFSIYVLNLSLQGPQGYAQVIAWFNQSSFRVAAIILIWALTHHLLAGVRHLLSDVDVGSQLPAARRSAWIVNLGSVVVALLATGVFL
ncbi:MAG: succinate dehydrogenase, cytochrome b556 subunit [Rugosibacter sp.]|nr:MAG: succinate dehydrogenase, cytochrome b556 subunit [Rugosibacter sp.]TBR10271.1 MAG: succinate dehydrogenase, cytochrome b556 subunit [Rugosibacter sp.]